LTVGLRTPGPAGHPGSLRAAAILPWWAVRPPVSLTWLEREPIRTPDGPAAGASPPQSAWWPVRGFRIRQECAEIVIGTGRSGRMRPAPGQH